MNKSFAKILILLFISLISACSEQDQTSTQKTPVPNVDHMATATKLANKHIIVDTHIDVPYRLQDKYEDISKATEDGDFDYPRAVRGGLNAPFMSIYIPAKYEKEGGAVELANELIDGVEKIVNDSPDKFALAYSTADIEKNFTDKKISMPMGMENGSPINGDMKNLKHFFDRGIRYITLTHSKSNHISDSSYDDNKQWRGLSEFGKKLVPAMNDIGIMIDISHVSDDAFYQVIELSKTPVIASHSSARRFTPGFERNMSDDMIKALAKNGGVIQINFGSDFVSQASRDSSTKYRKARDAFLEREKVERNSDKAKKFRKGYRARNPYRYATLEEVLDHFDHVVRLTSIDHVGIGSDYDGVGDSLPIGLKDVSTYPNLIAGLLKRGYKESDIEKILSGNLLRVWKQVEEYATQQKNKTNT